MAIADHTTPERAKIITARGVLNQLIAHLDEEERTALMTMLSDPAYSEEKVSQILRDEGRSADRDPSVPERLYAISPRTVGRWREANFPSEITGL